VLLCRIFLSSTALLNRTLKLGLPWQLTLGFLRFPQCPLAELKELVEFLAKEILITRRFQEGYAV
jgi:hypothetical protein